MVDSFRPLTILLGVVCLWSIAVLILALLGLGGRFSLLPDNPALMPALPTVAMNQGQSRLGPMSNYLEVGTRPLLMANRRPAPVEAEGSSQDIDATLTSVLITPKLKMAILTDNQEGGASHRVRVGDLIQGTGWRLIELAPRSAVLEGSSGRRTLELRVYNGTGGEPPTAPTTAPVASNQPPGGAPSPSNPTVTNPATPGVAASTPPSGEMTQEQQIESIRRRIQQRREAMRAEAARAEADKR